MPLRRRPTARRQVQPSVLARDLVLGPHARRLGLEHLVPIRVHDHDIHLADVLLEADRRLAGHGRLPDSVRPGQAEETPLRSTRRRRGRRLHVRP